MAYKNVNLKKLNGLLRVDSVSKVVSKGRLGTRASVYLSRVNPSCLEYKEIKGPYHRDVKIEGGAKIDIHAAALMHFITGSLWENGAKTHNPQLIGRYVIDPKKAQLVTLGEKKITGPNQPKPFTAILNLKFYKMAYGSKESFTSNYYVLVPVEKCLPIDNSGELKNRPKWLVIPCHEIIRFYYGISGRMLTSTLKGELGSLIDWDRSTLIEDKIPSIYPNKPLSRMEACVLGRAIFSEHFKSRMLEVHKVLKAQVATNANTRVKAPLIIKADFPIEVPTTLSVSGKAVRVFENEKDSDAGEWGVFVMEILKCDHPFGFSDIKINIPTAGIGAEKFFKRKFKAKPVKLPFEELHREDDVKRTPNPDINSHTTLITSAQFPELSKMKYEYIKVRRDGKAAAISFDGLLDVDGYSTSDGVGDRKGNKTQHLADFLAIEPFIPRNLETYLRMLEKLEEVLNQNSIEMAPRVINVMEASGHFPFSEFVLATNHKTGWIYMEDGGRRKCVISEFRTLGDNYFYLLEMQLSENEESGQCTIILFAKNRIAVNDKNLEDYLELTVFRKRWADAGNVWSDPAFERLAKEFFKDHFIYRIKHPSSKIMKEMEEMLLEEASPKITKFGTEKAGKIGGNVKMKRTVSDWANDIFDDINKIIRT